MAQQWLPQGRPTASHLARASGSPRRNPGPHNQVRPTYLTPRAGRRAGGRKAGRPRGQPGVGGGFEPHLKLPPRTTRRELGFGPDALPKSPRRRRRGSATAHHVRPRPQATAAAHGVPPRCGAGGRVALGRRQLTGGTAPQQPPLPPKELEPERAGPQ